MNVLLSPLRRVGRLAAKPVRFVRRLRQMNVLLAAAAARDEHRHQQLLAAVADLGRRQDQLAEQTAWQLEQARQHQSNKLQLLAGLIGRLSPVEQLRLAYPWPAVRPAVPPSRRGWDGGGRDLVTRRLVANNVKVVLEVGSFLGLSTRLWLDAVPDAVAVCIDPWFDRYDDDSGFRHWPDVVGKNIYHLFLSSNWEYRDRIVPVRGLSPAMLDVVADLGVKPDLIFIDGLHDYDSVTTDIETCHRLWPDAILTGDDWTHDKHTFPPRAVREAVEDFAARKGWRVDARDNTWALDR
jgi:hypothetical protein